MCFKHTTFKKAPKAKLIFSPMPLQTTPSHRPKSDSSCSAVPQRTRLLQSYKAGQKTKNEFKMTLCSTSYALACVGEK